MLTSCAKSCHALGFEVDAEPPEPQPQQGRVTNTVVCETTKGDIMIEIYGEWSPIGASRFIELVRDGFYTDIGKDSEGKRIIKEQALI